jgi:heme exporter protein D
MPDLGKYAAEVLASYGLSIAILLVLVGASIRRAKRTSAALEEVEARRKQNG